MVNKRFIEVFTAGCPICTETLQTVKEAVSSCGCEVIERKCSDKECCDEAKKYGITAVPTIVVDGVVVYQGSLTPQLAGVLLTR